MNDGRNGRYGFARGMLVVSCLFGASLRLAAVDVSWDASEKPATLDGGKITVTYDGDRVSALRIPCVAGGYAFGGDAIDFTDGGTVTVVSSDELPGGCVRFAQALRSPGKLSFASDFSQMSSALASGTARSATLPKVLLKDANLADYDIVSCRMGWASSGETFNLDGCKPYFVTRGEGWMTAQMQVLQTTEWVKCVKIRLEQRSTDVVLVQYDYAKYISHSYVGCGWDFDKTHAQETTVGSSYYLGDFTFLKKGRVNTVTVASDVGVATLDVGTNVLLTADGPSVLTNGTTYAAAVSLTGDMIVTNRAELTLTGTLTGTGSLTLAADGAATSQLPVRYQGDVPSRPYTDGIVPAATTVATGLNLASVAGISDAGFYQRTTASEFLADGIGCPDGSKGIFFWENDGSTASCQLQIRQGDYAKGLYIVFTQVDGDVKATSQSFYGPYTSFGKDMRLAENHYTGGSYKMTEFTFDIKPSALFTLAGTANTGSVRLRVAGNEEGRRTKALVTASTGLAKTVDIGAWGEVDLRPTDSGYLAQGTAICIGSNGIFRQSKRLCLADENGNAGNKITFDIAGGEYDLGSQSGDSSDWGNSTYFPAPYLNVMPFSNGGRLTGRAVRLASGMSCWSVSNAPAICSAAIKARGSNDATSTSEIKFDIDDVTGDERPDFTITSTIGKMMAEGTWTGGGFVKYGSGTLLHTAKLSFNYLPLRLRGGTWIAGVAEALPSCQGVSLEGGAIGVSDGVTATAGSIAVTAAGGGFTVGDGASLSFSAPAADAWVEEAPVDIRLGAGAALRVGTSSCLTRAQLSAVRCCRGNRRYRVRQLGDGRLVADVGTTVIIR